jgi:hypothetical protein
VAEEYFWAITQAEQRECCGQSHFIVLESPLNIHIANRLCTPIKTWEIFRLSLDLPERNYCVSLGVTMNVRCNDSALFPSPFLSRIVHAFCIYQPIYTQSFTTFVNMDCIKFPLYRQIAVAITDDASLLKPQIFSCFGSQACSILTFLTCLSRCCSDVPVRIFAAVE